MEIDGVPHRGRRIGFVVPSSNTVVEPLAADLFAGTGVSAHFTRLRVHDVALDEVSRAQFALESLLEAAALLADADVDAIVWGGTSASWLGAQHDQAFSRACMDRTGIPTTSCVLAINQLLDAQRPCRFGLVSPYTDDVSAQIVANYADLGHVCVDSANVGGLLSRDFADIEPDELSSLVRAVARRGPDVVVIMCTNLRGAAVAGRLRTELGIPVIDSADATVRAGLDLLELTIQSDG